MLTSKSLSADESAFICADAQPDQSKMLPEQLINDDIINAKSREI